MNITLGALIAIFLVCLLLGWLIGWLLSKARHIATMSRLQESAAGQLTASQQDLALYKATSAEQMQALRRDIDRIQEEKSTLAHELVERVEQVTDLQKELATAKADARSAN